VHKKRDIADSSLDAVFTIHEMCSGYIAPGHDQLCYVINTIISETLDPLQFAYCPNRSTDDAISIALHTALSHLEKRNTYVRMLFIDYSSAFNTIVPMKLITKLRTLGLNTSLCN
jgi:hypothetical protein